MIKLGDHLTKEDFYKEYSGNNRRKLTNNREFGKESEKIINKLRTTYYDNNSETGFKELTEKKC